MGASYSVYETKTRLSEILRAVRRGTPVTITDRHRAVAKIVRIEEPADEAAHYRALEESGAIQRSTIRRRVRFPALVRNPGGVQRFLADRHRD